MIGVPEKRENVVVDSFQEKQGHMAHVQKMRTELHGIDVIYELEDKSNKLFIQQHFFPSCSWRIK